MISAERATYPEAPELALSRRLRDLRQIATSLKRSGVTPLQLCQSIIGNRLLDSGTRSFFSGLPEDEKHYWIASLYALLMPKARRRRLAAYFTPPHLARYAIDTLIEAGIQPGEHRILDPASGGAAFLVPLAARISDQARQRGARGETVLRAIESSLAGVEIEPDLAILSKGLLFDLLRKEIGAAGRKPTISIQRADTLKLPPPERLYDAAIGNPPYGRIFRPSKTMLKAFAPVISDGYVNLYALFLEQTIRWVKPGGVVCLIVPMSFVGGPYFTALRKRILETSHVLRLDPIDKRSDVFLDVLYDVCVLVLRKKGSLARNVVPKSSLLMIGQPDRTLGTLEIPEDAGGSMWALPDEKQKEGLFQAGRETLADYGYIAKTGYFVWNREQHRYRTGKKPRSTEVPLFWAHNVTANRPCRPVRRKTRFESHRFCKNRRGEHCDNLFGRDHSSANQQSATGAKVDRCCRPQSQSPRRARIRYRKPHHRYHSGPSKKTESDTGGAVPLAKHSGCRYALSPDFGLGQRFDESVETASPSSCNNRSCRVQARR